MQITFRNRIINCFILQAYMMSAQLPRNVCSHFSLEIWFQLGQATEYYLAPIISVPHPTTFIILCKQEFSTGAKEIWHKFRSLFSTWVTDAFHAQSLRFLHFLGNLIKFLWHMHNNETTKTNIKYYYQLLLDSLICFSFEIELQMFFFLTIAAFQIWLTFNVPHRSLPLNISR